jgi:chromosome segregation ATPase
MEFSKEGDSNRSNGSLSNNLTEFKEAFKSGIKRMEAFLQEVESTVSTEAQQYEELRQRAEVKVGLLEGQLHEKEEDLRSKESAIKQLEENLTSKIQEVEHRLTEKEKLSSLLEKHNSEIMILRSQIEAKVDLLEGQLQEKEEDLTSKIQELEQCKREDGVAYRSKISNRMRVALRFRTILSSMVGIVPSGRDRLTEKEGQPRFLEKHDSEITILRAETEAKVGLLEGQLQEKEEDLRSKESAIKQLEESLTSKNHELEHLVKEKESQPRFLEKHVSEIMILRAETEAKVDLLEGQLHEREESLRSKESAIKQLEESFTAKTQEMEDQPNEKESLLEIRQGDLNDLKSKLDSFGNAPESVNTLREEDEVTLNLPANKEEKGMVPSKVQEKMTSSVEDWREQLMRVCGR